MSKEYLEALNGLFDLVHCQDSFEKAQKYFDIIEEALNRLEAIEKGKNTDIIDNYMAFKNDNANPNEALEIVDKMTNYILLDEEYDFIDDKEKQSIIKDRDTIKQALLKAQEPKQYLKWEDLEFNHKPVFTEAKMGKTIYKLVIGFDCTGKETIFLRTDNQQIVFHEKDIQFFNDLRLERVEE